MERLKKYNITLGIVINNAELVIDAGRQRYADPDDWEEQVEEVGGDKLMAAIAVLFVTPGIIPEEVGEAVDLFNGSCEQDGDVPADWYRR